MTELIATKIADKYKVKLCADVIKDVNACDGYCPCVTTAWRTKDYICPCKTFRDTQRCSCGLFEGV